MGKAQKTVVFREGINKKKQGRSSSIGGKTALLLLLIYQLDGQTRQNDNEETHPESTFIIILI